ncbi:hypothetical protein BT63DRAFT_424232 [Microthyrium microscopicum]|uniref:nitric oxide dioxygenase n=1 Tax=Microthyrium microscopicum TaxID=703497 RepID=A0A6A6UFG0_9PEZI|nr:hypothetical protein BT63DRAFT_424232 [Microthyrium microscopicum]
MSINIKNSHIYRSIINFLNAITIAQETMPSETNNTCPVSGASSTPTNGAAPTCPFANANLSQPNTSQNATPSDPNLAVPEPYRSTPLTESQKALIKASIPALESHGLAITKLFYTNMLIAHPELRNIFNASNQAHFQQPRALANAVLAYAQHIDDPSPLMPTVELIVSKHVSLGVQADYYAVVGEWLIKAIAEVLGEAVTPELGEAWMAAYWKLAQIFIGLEASIYEKQKSEGWEGWQDFRVVKKVKESEEITSFYLEPVESRLKPLVGFKPGQFISIQVDVPEMGHRQARQYSLSDSSNPDYLRVSIKKETGNGASAPGVVSSLMHETKKEGDIIRVSRPVGVFFLDEAKIALDAPLVLISGGVGLTPLTAMLNHSAAQNTTRPISWVHGARSTAARAFKQHVEDVAKLHENVQVILFTANVAKEEVEGVENHIQGHINLDLVDKETKLFLSNKKAEYYVCGPMMFMLTMEKALQGQGVDSSRIHMEKFGTGGIAPVEQESPKSVL